MNFESNPRNMFETTVYPRYLRIYFDGYVKMFDVTEKLTSVNGVCNEAACVFQKQKWVVTLGNRTTQRSHAKRVAPTCVFTSRYVFTAYLHTNNPHVLLL